MGAAWGATLDTGVFLGLLAAVAGLVAGLWLDGWIDARTARRALEARGAPQGHPDGAADAPQPLGAPMPPLRPATGACCPGHHGSCWLAHMPQRVVDAEFHDLTNHLDQP